MQFGTGIPRGTFATPLRRRFGVAEDVVVGVEDVDVGLRREVRVEGEAEDAAVTGVVDLGPHVGEELRGAVFDVVEDEDLAGLLGDEDAAVRGEAEVARFLEAGDHRFVLEAGCFHARALCRCRAGREQADTHRDQARKTPR